MTAPREMTEGEVSARMQWAVLHVRIARERRMAAVSRAFAWAWAITLAVALGIVLAKAPGVCAATLLQAEEQQGW